MKEIIDFITPLVKEGISVREAARQSLGYAPLPTDEPGGTMMAVNVAEEEDPASKNYDPNKPTVILHPFPKTVPQHGVNEMQKSENEESKPVGARDYARFANNMMNFVNASNVPLKVTVTEFTVMADQVHSVKTYIVRVDNG